MKQVYSYQEIGTQIDQHKNVVFTCHPEARVTAIQRHPDSDTVTITINLSIRDTCIGIMENEYASLADLLDAFNIDDLEEIWELLDP